MGTVRRQVVGVATAAIALTLLALTHPAIRFGYPLPGLAMFVAAISSFTCLALAALFLARHRRTHLVSDLLVSIAFGVTALPELVLAIAPELDPDLAGIAYWARTMGRTFVAIALCAAAWTHRARPRPAGAPSVVGGCIAGASVLVGYTVLMQHNFPRVGRGQGLDAGDLLLLEPVSVGFRVAGTALLVLAATGFTLRALKTRDPLLPWLAAGTVVLGAARLHFLLYPSLHSDWFTTGDLLRTIGQSVLLVGVALEWVRDWRQRIVVAAVEERRRVARDLHDGLAQELAWLTTQSDLVASGEGGRESLEGLALSAERALTETRLAIVKLSEREDVRLDTLLETLAHQIGTRYGREVHLDLHPVDVDETTSRELALIAREALTNAVRHSSAGQLALRLYGTDDSVNVIVRDNGTGLDPSRANSTGFGLTSMRERAAQVGGRCSIVSHPGNGTIVAVEVPRP
jgi:signal transduction histidine kinase